MSLLLPSLQWFTKRLRFRDDNDDLWDAFFTGGPRYTGSCNFIYNSRQCRDLTDYLEEAASSLTKQIDGLDEERIRVRCERAMKELCYDITEAKQFLQHCSGTTLNAYLAITKLHTREAYHVLLHNLIWSKAGLDLAIQMIRAADDAGVSPHLAWPDLQEELLGRNILYDLVKRQVKECKSLLSTYSAAGALRLKRDIEEFRTCVQRSAGSTSVKKKCLDFLMKKYEADPEESNQYAATGTETAQRLIDACRVDPVDILPLQKGSVIGQGAFGMVYRSKWLGQDVAVKVVCYASENASSCEAANNVFKKEASILASLHSPFIIHMVGWCIDENKDCMLVTELAQNDLHHWAISSDKKFKLSVHAAVDIMLQISKGMEYLHRKKIIHRDIKPSNVLLKPSSVKELAAEGYARVKLCDFGLAKIKDLSAADQSKYTTRNMGTQYYRAPEVFEASEDEEGANESKYGREADIFSFGITCYELLQGRSAAEYYMRSGNRGMLSSKELRKKMIVNNVRPEFLPDSCPSHLVQLIQRCWDTDIKRRPSFNQMSNTLTHIKFILKTVSKVQRSVHPDDYHSVVVKAFDKIVLKGLLTEEDGESEAGNGETSSTSPRTRGNEELEEYSNDQAMTSSASARTRGNEELEEFSNDQAMTRSCCLLMTSGKSLRTHECIVCNGYKFAMQPLGMLVLYGPPNPAGVSPVLWASHTRQDKECTCVLEEDGNLVIYGSGRGAGGSWHPNHVVWSSNSSPDESSAIRAAAGGYKLELEIEWNRAVIRGPSGNIIWATDESVERRRMRSGQFLVAHQWMLCKGYKLEMQGDGNLVLYDAARKALWASCTRREKAVCICKLEDDGSLVIYDTSIKLQDGDQNSYEVVWCSNRKGPRGTYQLELEIGRAVIRGLNGALIWTTHALP